MPLILFIFYFCNIVFGESGSQKLNFQTCSGDSCFELISIAYESRGVKGVYRLQDPFLVVSQHSKGTAKVQKFLARGGLYNSEANLIIISEIKSGKYKEVEVNLNSGRIHYIN